MDADFPYMEVNLDQIKKNLSEICKKTSKDASKVIAVVKDNSYGLGAGNVAKVLHDVGVVWFCTATIKEALFLRKRGISGDILVLGRTDESSFQEAWRHNITLSIIDTAQLSAVEKNRYDFKWHLNIDTGMRRDGIAYSLLNDGGATIETLLKSKSCVSGIYTHFHSSDDRDQSATDTQKRQFKKAVSNLQNAGFNFDVIHTSNSGACLYSKVEEKEYIRAGVLLYGCRPDPSRPTGIDVAEAVKICALVSGVRSVKKGDGVSYGHTWKASQDTKIATIAVGYSDGFPRALSETAYVVIKGEKYPVVGRVTMDYILADVGASSSVKVGDEVIAAGNAGANLGVGIDELALNARTIGYELLCKFGAAMNHRYISGSRTVKFHERELF